MEEVGRKEACTVRMEGNKEGEGKKDERRLEGRREGRNVKAGRKVGRLHICRYCTYL